jgi:hypothetical protein
MKPRLIKIRGAWHCAILLGPRGQRIGIGFTPKQAFDDWNAGSDRAIGRYGR